MTERDNLRAFFANDMKKLVPVQAVEKMADVPVKTLDHFLNSRRDISDDHLAKVIVVLEKVGYRKI